uniref:Uncharacterized protein n=1 Tax=Plectus sambesii TaxID=2011161 RepID=A0A914XKR9_9BILA
MHSVSVGKATAPVDPIAADAPPADVYFNCAAIGAPCASSPGPRSAAMSRRPQWLTELPLHPFPPTYPLCSTAEYGLLSRPPPSLPHSSSLTRAHPRGTAAPHPFGSEATNGVLASY